MSGLKTAKTSSGKIGLGSLEIKDVQAGEIFLCTQDVRMLDDGELVYKKGEFYKSERYNCITDRAGRIDHYWDDTDWTPYFIKWRGHKRKSMDTKRYTLQESWFSGDLKENHVTKEVWNNALDFEKFWLKNHEVDPEWWNVTGWGTIVCDIETEDGVISVEIGRTQLGFYTDFNKGIENYTVVGFDWPVHEELLSETLKMLLKRYEKSKV